MANKEQDYKPQAKPADEATKPCQEFIRLYPTRFALTDKAFENIKTKGEIPLLPKNSSGDENYDVRRLRDGYVYILAVNAEVKDVLKLAQKRPMVRLGIFTAIVQKMWILTKETKRTE